MRNMKNAHKSIIYDHPWSFAGVVISQDSFNILKKYRKLS